MITGVNKPFEETNTVFKTSYEPTECRHWFDGSVMHLSVYPKVGLLKMLGRCVYCGSRVMVVL